MPEHATISSGGREVETIQELHRRYALLKQQLAGLIIGMDDVIEQLLIAHAVPGALHSRRRAGTGQDDARLERRVPAWPELSADPVHAGPDAGGHHGQRRAGGGPRDRQAQRSGSCKGPLFANIILADEINRTPPKTQAALLEAMQERQVTVGGVTYPLPDPFFVLATQNPIEQEGTYPLPEAQLDRFMMKIHVGYPSEADEIAIAKRATTAYSFDGKVVLEGETIEQMQSVVRQVPTADHIYADAVRFVRESRPSRGVGQSSGAGNGEAGSLSQMVSWGAGPRGSINLLLAAKARARPARAVPRDERRPGGGGAAGTSPPNPADLQCRSRRPHC